MQYIVWEILMHLGGRGQCPEHWSL